MCGRSSLTKTEKELEKRFGANFYSEDLERYNPLPNYNVAPTHVLPILTQENPLHFVPMRWGLIPSWAKDVKIAYRMINARVETLLEKRTFKYAVSTRRCIIPGDGFFEWKKTDDGKQPYYIHLKSNETYAYAGLYDKWLSPEGHLIHSFTIITQAPNTLVAEIHDRMPAILDKSDEKVWISNNEISPNEILKLIKPLSPELMEAVPVNKSVNNVRNNSPENIKPIDLDNKQNLTLF